VVALGRGERVLKKGGGRVRRPLDSEKPWFLQWRKGYKITNLYHQEDEKNKNTEEGKGGVPLSTSIYKGLH